MSVTTKVKKYHEYCLKAKNDLMLSSFILPNELSSAHE